MNIMEVAELVSAIAALVTVVCASYELVMRSRNKKADMAMELYADILHIDQAVAYAVRSQQILIERMKDLTQEEIEAYAQKHMVKTSLFALVDATEKKYICNQNPAKKENQELAKMALEMSGKISSLLTSINTLYQLLLRKDKDFRARLQEHSARIALQYEQLQHPIGQAKVQLRCDLKKVHKSERAYVIIWIAAVILVAAINLAFVIF